MYARSSWLRKIARCLDCISRVRILTVEEAGAQNPVLIKAPIIYEYETLLNKYKCIKRWDETPRVALVR